MTLSAGATVAVNASSTDVAFFFLLTITGAPGLAPIRVVNNDENLLSRGELYQAYPFQLKLPDSVEDNRVPTLSLTIDNVDRLIMDSVRAQTTPPKVTVEVVTSTNLDFVERAFTGMELRNVSYNALTVTGTLVMADILSVGFPGETYDAVSYPAIG